MLQKLPGMLIPWLHLTRNFLSTRTFRRIASAVILCSLYSGAIELCQKYVFKQDVQFTSSMHILMAFAISIALGYKTNASYDRWWEARKQWGNNLAAARSFSALVLGLSKVPKEAKQQALQFLTEFSIALKDHVRNQWPKPSNRPLEIHLQQILQISAWRDQDWISGKDFQILEQHLSSRVLVLGACERLRGNLLPPTHRVLGQQLVSTYILVMPWGMVSHLSNVLLVAGISYALLGLAAVSEDIEEPFGLESDDLDLDGLCGSVQRSVDLMLTALDSQELPLAD